MAATINGDGLITLDGTSTTQGRVRLAEDTDNGTNYVELQAPANVASNVTFTLPGADGTSGQVLQTNGSGTLSFTTLASSSFVYISTTTASSASTVDFTTLDSTYPLYVIYGTNIVTSSTSARYYMRLYAAGAWRTNLYNYAVIGGDPGASSVSLRSATSQSTIDLYGDTQNAAASGQTGGLTLYVPYTTSTSIYRTLWWQGTIPKTNAAPFIGTGYWSDSILDPVTGVRIYPSTGTISGTFTLYGIKNS